MENPYGTTITPHYYRHHPSSTNASSPHISHQNHHHHMNDIISHHPQQHYHQLPVIVNNGIGQQLGQKPSLLIGNEQNGSIGNGPVAHSTQIIVVEPPRPPFIPKKPVYNNGATATTSNNSGTHHPPSYPHLQNPTQKLLPPYQINHIYAPPITSTTVTSTATTTTYIGSCESTAGNSGPHSIDTESNRNLSNSSTNSSNSEGGDIVQYSPMAEAEIRSNFPVVIQQKTPENIAENNNNHCWSPSTTNSFGINSSTPQSQQNTSSQAAAIVVQDLRNRFSNSAGKSNNCVEKTAQKQQRRLSLIGGIPQQHLQQMDLGQRPPISSFGCSDAGRIREGRIYATAGFGNTPKKLGTISSMDGGLKSAGSQICLRENVHHDGKSTLSRKAQKFAQKAAHKLTMGALGSELSNSASALYSLFTSSSANGIPEDDASFKNIQPIYSETNGTMASSHSSNIISINFWVRKYKKILN
jgi:hypothetical protein